VKVKKKTSLSNQKKRGDGGDSKQEGEFKVKRGLKKKKTPGGLSMEREVRKENVNSHSQ